MANTGKQTVSGRCSACWFGGYLVAVFILSAVTAALVVRVIHGTDGFWADLLADQGPARFTRRILVLWTVLLFVPVMRRCGWQGWKDTGWTVPNGSTGYHGYRWLFASGLLLGIAAMGLLSLVHLFAGNRGFDDVTVAEVIGRISAYGLSAVVIGVLEETFSRGILFRVLGRSWGLLMAALVTSVIFSLAHFIDPDASRFMGDGLLHTAWQVLYGMFADMPAHHFFRLRLLNLVLLGCVLCLFTARSGSIWLSVGTHAGCVWIMKLNGFLTDTMHPVSQATRLLGQRSDMTDSLMGTAALGLLGVCGLMAIRRIRP